MEAYAGLVTGQGTGAIGTILVLGDGAEGIIREVFRAAGDKKAELKVGEHCLGGIFDGDERIDEVVIGREGDSRRAGIAINCHGNPLIVSRILELLETKGARIADADEIMRIEMESAGGWNSIQAEAKLAIARVRTLEGTEIICEQVEGGLSERVEHWNSGELRLEEIREEAKEILKRSEIARMVVFGCRVVLAGTANSGKSTLFNQLCGRARAIVSETKGTTRDWVSAECNICGLSVELIDTAGLDEELAGGGDIDREAQERAIGLVEGADVVLLVLDASEGSGQVSAGLLEKLNDKRVVVVVNKCDLERRLDLGGLKLGAWQVVEVCAKTGAGMERLAAAIREVTEVDRLKKGEAVCLTGRQGRLVRELSEAQSRDQVGRVAAELPRWTQQ